MLYPLLQLAWGAEAVLSIALYCSSYGAHKPSAVAQAALTCALPTAAQAELTCALPTAAHAELTCALPLQQLTRGTEGDSERDTDGTEEGEDDTGHGQVGVLRPGVVRRHHGEEEGGVAAVAGSRRKRRRQRRRSDEGGSGGGGGESQQQQQQQQQRGCGEGGLLPLGQLGGVGQAATAGAGACVQQGVDAGAPEGDRGAVDLQGVQFVVELPSATVRGMRRCGAQL